MENESVEVGGILLEHGDIVTAMWVELEYYKVGPEPIQL